MTKPKLIVWAVSEILPSKDNPRIVTDDEADLNSDGLLDSVKAIGVQQPLQVRDHPTEKGQKELLAGERRWMCCKVAGVETVQVLDYGRMPDDEAFKITCIENAHRKELKPLEQGRAAAIALARCKGDVKAAAALLGQTPRWIAMGAKIHDGLAKEWQEGLRKNGLLKHWTAGHLAFVARFPADVQKDLFQHFVQQNDYRVKEMSVDDVEKETDAFLRLLVKAPFDTELCDDCPKRSDCEPTLWAKLEAQAVGKNARCLDPKCYAAKEREAARAAFSQAAAEHKGLVAVDLTKNHDHRDGSRLREVYGSAFVGGPQYFGSQLYEVVPEGTRGAVPAFVVAGPKQGKVVPVKYKGNASSASAKPKKSKAEVEEAKEKKAAIRAVQTIIKSRLAAMPIQAVVQTPEQLAGLLFCATFFGCGGISSWGNGRSEFLGEWLAIEDTGQRIENLWRRIWERLLQSFGFRLLSADHASRWSNEDDRDLRALINGFGWDYDSLVEEAKAKVAREEDLRQRTEIIPIKLPKPFNCSCELRILEDGGKWFGGYAIEIPKDQVDLPVDTQGQSYESKAHAVRAMAEAAGKWLANRKAEKKCPMTLYKPLATAIAEVVGACELELQRSGQGPTPANCDGDCPGCSQPGTCNGAQLPGKAANVKPSGLLEEYEQINVTVPKGSQAAVTIKIGQAEKLWYVGYTCHVPGGGHSKPCSVAQTDYTLRNDALAAAYKEIGQWLDGAPGKRGYKHYDAIKAAVLEACRSAAKSTKGACDGNRDLCTLACIPCSGKPGDDMSSPRTKANERSGPPVVDLPRRLSLVFPESYQACGMILAQRIDGYWYGGFEITVGAVLENRDIQISLANAYHSKAACLNGMLKEITAWIGGPDGKVLEKRLRVQVVARIDEAIEEELKKQTCHVCGCTEDDCQACIEATGEPCHWVEDDLCSRCQLQG